MAGFPCANSQIQHRYPSGINELINSLYYKGKVEVARTNDNRSAVHKFRVAMKSMYDIDRNWVLVNCPSKEQKINGGVSNLIACEKTWTIVRDLVNKHKYKPTDILVLAPYVAQWQAYRSRRNQNKSYKDVMVETIRRVQGQQRSITIVDLVRTEKVAFLNEADRTNLAFSRAQDGLIVMMASTDLGIYRDPKNDFEGSILQRVAKKAKEMGCYHKG